MVHQGDMVQMEALVLLLSVDMAEDLLECQVDSLMGTVECLAWEAVAHPEDPLVILLLHLVEKEDMSSLEVVEVAIKVSKVVEVDMVKVAVGMEEVGEDMVEEVAMEELVVDMVEEDLEVVEVGA